VKEKHLYNPTTTSKTLSLLEILINYQVFKMTIPTELRDKIILWGRATDEVETLEAGLREDMYLCFANRDVAIANREQIEEALFYALKTKDPNEQLAYRLGKKIKDEVSKRNRNPKQNEFFAHYQTLSAKLTRWAMKLITAVYGGVLEIPELPADQNLEEAFNAMMAEDQAPVGLNALNQMGNSDAMSVADDVSAVGLNAIHTYRNYEEKAEGLGYKDIDGDEQVGEKRLRSATGRAGETFDEDETDDTDEISVLTDIVEREDGRGVDVHVHRVRNGGKHSFLGRRTSGGQKLPDKYYTPKEAVLSIVEILKKCNITHIWEPMAGEGHIVKVLQSENFNVIGWDRDGEYAIEGYDFLTLKLSDVPDCQVIISNPAFSIKYEVLEKLRIIDKPFMMLLPIECLATVKFKEIYDKFTASVDIGLLAPPPKFEHEGKKVQVSPCAWFAYGFTQQKEGEPKMMRMIYLN